MLDITVTERDGDDEVLNTFDNIKEQEYYILDSVQEYMLSVAMELEIQIIKTGIQDWKKGLSRGMIMPIFYQEELDKVDKNGKDYINNLYIKSYSTETKINIEFLEESNHKVIRLSIKDGDNEVINTTFGLGIVMKNEIKQIIAVANIINFCLTQLDVSLEDKLGNAKFEVLKRFLGEYDLVLNGIDLTKILTQKKFESILNGKPAKEGENTLGSNPINSVELMNRMANYLNKKFSKQKIS